MTLSESKQGIQAITKNGRVTLPMALIMLLFSSLLQSACTGSNSSAMKDAPNSVSINSDSVPRTNITIDAIEYQPVLHSLALPTYWAIDSEPNEAMLSSLNAQLATLSEYFSGPFFLGNFALGIKLEPRLTHAYSIDIAQTQLGQSRVVLTLGSTAQYATLTQPLATAIYRSLRQAHQVEDGLLDKLVSHGLALHFIESQLKAELEQGLERGLVSEPLYQQTQFTAADLTIAIELASNAIDTGNTVSDWFTPQRGVASVTVFKDNASATGTDFKDNASAWKLGYYLVEQHFLRYPGSDAQNSFAVNSHLFHANLALPITIEHKTEQYVRTSDVAEQVGVSELTRQATQFSGTYFLEGWNQQKLIALTFDDGPSIYTSKILDLLAEEEVKASFFWTGENMLANKAIMQRTLADGHTLANHSWDHPHGRALSTEKLWQEQVLKTNQLFESMVGVSPRFYRPPFGEITDEQIAFLDEQGMKVILWSVDTRDWNAPIITVDNISDVVIQNQHPEVISLMHDAGGNRQNTLDALPDIIEHYRSQGYGFVNLEQMLGISDKR